MGDGESQPVPVVAAVGDAHVGPPNLVVSATYGLNGPYMAVYNQIWSIWTIFGEMVMSTLPSDPGPGPGTPARHGLLPPALRRDLADLNGQFLDLSLARTRPSDLRFGWAEPVRRRLREIDRPTRTRMAAAPFALFRLFLPVLPWPLSPSPPAASRTCRCRRRRRRAGSLAVVRPPGGLLRPSPRGQRGPMPPASCSTSRPRPSRGSAMSPSQLAEVAGQPGLVRPRWPDHLRFWEMLAAPRGAIRPSRCSGRTASGCACSASRPPARRADRGRRPATAAALTSLPAGVAH